MVETEVKIYFTQHNSMLRNAFATFFEKQDYLDVTFVCKGGKKVLANKLVLSTVSSFLKSLLSTWEGTQEMITLLLPEVDHSILKLALDFIYAGRTKLSEDEFKEFNEILKMLNIILPGATVIQRNGQYVAQDPPPPLAKLQKKQVSLRTNSTKENSDAEKEDPDDDPLNVPDLYYVPSTLTGQKSINADQGSKNNVADQQTRKKKRKSTNANEASKNNVADQRTGKKKKVRVRQDPDVNKPEANDSSTSWQDGITKRKRIHQQANSEKQSSSDTPNTKRSLGKKSSAHNREDSVDKKKRIQPRKSSESNNSSGTLPGMDEDGRSRPRKQSFTYIKEDSKDFMVNDTVSAPRSKAENT